MILLFPDFIALSQRKLRTAGIARIASSPLPIFTRILRMTPFVFGIAWVMNTDILPLVGTEPAHHPELAKDPVRVSSSA